MEDSRWDCELADHREWLDRAPRSARLRLSSGAEVRIATREDYAGVLGEPVDWASSPDLVAAVQAQWHAEGHNACVFAEYLPQRRADHGWETYVLAGRDGPDADAAAIAAIVSDRLPAVDVEIVSLIVPHAGDAAHMAAIVRHLSGVEHWRLRDEGEEEDAELGTLKRLGLDVDVGLDHWSEVLGFGPFGPFARTRRAPFCEFAIRAKPPRRPDRERRANMDQVELLDVGPMDRSDWWHRTKLQRADRLGEDHDMRGKARVTVVVGEEDWRAMSS